MLADTDAGSIITAAQSGAQWGYSLLLLQFVLIPILYIVQELTVRLGVVTGKGHAELIRRHFGRGWAWLSVATLIVTCLGALLTEFAGLAGVGNLMGVPAPVTLALVVAALLGMALMHGYRTVDASPSPSAPSSWFSRRRPARPSGPGGSRVRRAGDSDLDDPEISPARVRQYRRGDHAVDGVLPAVLGRREGRDACDLPSARLDTAIGAVVTQLIMAAVLIAVAATLGKAGGDHALDTVEEIVGAITPFLGSFAGKLLFCFGMAGAALVATIVVTLTAARALAEVMGARHRLEDEPREAPWFYGFYALALIACAIVVGSGVNLISLAVGVQVMNAILLPIVLGFLYLLARRLPQPYRLKGAYAGVCRHRGDSRLWRLFRRRWPFGLTPQPRRNSTAERKGISAGRLSPPDGSPKPQASHMIARGRACRLRSLGQELRLLRNMAFHRL